MANRPYKNFVQKRRWKKVDYDGSYGFQCTDLAKQYISEGLEFGKIGALGNAKDMPKSPFFAQWEKIKGMNNLMQGDIIIKSQGKYWHVAVVDHILNGKVYVLEQNWSGKDSGSGLGANSIRIQPYNLSFYDTILRCKKIFDNLVLEREFVAEKLKNLEGVEGQENEIKITKEYLATTRYEVK